MIELGTHLTPNCPRFVLVIMVEHTWNISKKNGLTNSDDTYLDR